MLSVLIEGTLTATPVQRTTVKGQPFATAKLRASGEDGEHRAGLKVTATRVLSVYAAGKKRGAASEKASQAP